MRISDWSSDVCSSDLRPLPPLIIARNPRITGDSFLPHRHGGLSFRNALLESQDRGGTSRLFYTHRGTESLPTIGRSEEHTSELQSLMRISYAVLCLKNKKNKTMIIN